MTIFPHTKAFDNWVALWRVAGTSLLLLLTLIGKVQGQDFTYVTNNGTITITDYHGSGGAVTIPDMINGLPVTSIEGGALFSGIPPGVTSVTIPNTVTNIGLSSFAFCLNLTAISVDTRNPVYSDVDGVLFSQSLTALVQYPGGIAGSYIIPNSVTSIGAAAFAGCTNLTSVTIPNNITSIGDSTFYQCFSLTNVTIPNSVTNIRVQSFSGISVTSLTIPNRVTSIGFQAFWSCTRLTNVTIPNSVTSIGQGAFQFCTSLTGVFFTGNAPLGDSLNFLGDTNATVYYLPGTTGWGTTWSGRPTMLWNPQVQTNDGSFGVRQNQFGFNIAGTPDIPLVVEATVDLSATAWIPLQSCTLTNGLFYFSDQQWKNYSERFYRIRSP